MNPHLALLIAQIIGSLNSVISRAAFVISPDADPLTTSVPTPLTFAVWRVLIASCVLTILRYFIVKRPPTNNNSKNNSNQHQNNNYNNNTNEEAVAFFKDKVSSIPPSTSPSSSNYSLSMPMPHPSVNTILQVCLLGAVVITGNFSLFFFGVAFTDAITLASMMCMIPPICFVLGFLMGMESFTIPKALSTLLVVCGNFVMAHVWRVFMNGNSNNNSHLHSSEDNDDGAEVGVIHHPHAHHHHVDQHAPHALKQQASDGTTAHRYFLGVFFLFMAFVCWSLYLLLQRAIVKKMHLLDFLFYLYWSALAGLLTISVFHPEGDSIFKQVVEGQLSAFAWGAILYAGCIQSIGTYFLVSYATCKADSSLLAALYNGLMPLFVTVEAIILLGETMDEWQVIGGGIVVCGWVSSMIAISKDGSKKNVPGSASTTSSTTATVMMDENTTSGKNTSSSSSSFVVDVVSSVSPTTAMLLQQIPLFSSSPPNVNSNSITTTIRTPNTPKDRVV